MSEPAKRNDSSSAHTLAATAALARPVWEAFVLREKLFGRTELGPMIEAALNNLHGRESRALRELQARAQQLRTAEAALTVELWRVDQALRQLARAPGAAAPFSPIVVTMSDAGLAIQRPKNSLRDVAELRRYRTCVVRHLQAVRHNIAVDSATMANQQETLAHMTELVPILRDQARHVLSNPSSSQF